MAHHHNNSAYGRLADRINRFPLGAPPTALLFDILKMLFSEQEAGLVAQLPIKPFTASDAAKIWQRPLTEARNVLENLAARAILVDMEQDGEQQYCLPPPMAGFFEFSLMRVRHDLDQKALSELFYQYMNVEEDFIKALFVEGDTALGRVFVQEPALKSTHDPLHDLEILDYERASQVIATASHIGVSQCYCRHKMSHVGKACNAPQDICMTFNTVAASLITHGHARSLDKAECTDLLHKAYAHHLVQFGENNREGVNFICNCCGCCCEALLAVKRFGICQTIRSNFIVQVNKIDCIHCGACTKVCPINALAMNKHIPERDLPINQTGINNQTLFVNHDICLGCGVCVRACPKGCITLVPRATRTITPLNTVHRVLVMATERGKLQELIRDNGVLLSHRLLAAVLGGISKLPGAKKAMAQAQLKSRYIEKMTARM